MAKQYDEVVVVALLLALRDKGGSLAPYLKDMHALDGNRSISGFEHSLRAANKLAGELLAKKQSGEVLTPADLSGNSATAPTSATPKKRRGAKADNADTPSKKPRKSTAKNSATSTPQPKDKVRNGSNEEEDTKGAKSDAKVEEEFERDAGEDESD